MKFGSADIRLPDHYFETIIVLLEFVEQIRLSAAIEDKIAPV
jgi:hypothetical protein